MTFLTGKLVSGSITTTSINMDPQTLDLFFTDGRKNMHPGVLTIGDDNGAEVTITPTGTNAYRINTTPADNGAALRVNSRMHQTIREHIDRCLNYSKPKPNTETDDA